MVEGSRPPHTWTCASPNLMSQSLSRRLQKGSHRKRLKTETAAAPVLSRGAGRLPGDPGKARLWLRGRRSGAQAGPGAGPGRARTSAECGPRQLRSQLRGLLRADVVQPFLFSRAYSNRSGAESTFLSSPCSPMAPFLLATFLCCSRKFGLLDVSLGTSSWVWGVLRLIIKLNCDQTSRIPLSYP